MDVPGAIAWSEDGKVGDAIAVVIRRDGNITVRTIGEGAYSLMYQVPLLGRKTASSILPSPL